MTIGDRVPCTERVLRAIDAKLLALVDVPDVVVERGRTTALRESEFPRVVQTDGGWTPAVLFTGQDDYRQVVRVDVYARNALEKARIEAMIVAAMAADFTLGGMVRNVEPAEAGPPDLMTNEHFDRGFLASGLAFAVEYATVEGDPCAFLSDPPA